VNKPKKFSIFIIIIAAIIAVFIADTQLRLGMAAGFAYIILLFISSRYLEPQKTILITILASVSVVLSVFLPDITISETAIFNRLLALLLLWMLAFLLLRYRKVEEALRISELQYRTIVEATYEGIIIPDKNGIIKFANKRILNLLNYTEEELISKKFDDLLLDPVSSEMWNRTEIVEEERSLSKKDGTSVLASVSFIPVDQKWNNIKSFVVIRDITSRKKTEEALRESQARLSGIVSSAMDGIITINSDQNIILFNKAAEKLFGYSQEEILGRHIGILIPGDIREIHKTYVRKFGETGTTNRHMGALGAVRGLKKNGIEFPIEASISQVKSSGEKLYSVILRDITEREIARQQLLESENRFRNMADNAPVLIWLSNETDEFVYFNKTWLTFTGRSVWEETGWGWTDNIHPEEKEEVIRLHRESFNQRKAFISEFRLLRNDETYRWILIHGIPRFTSEQQYNGFIGSCVDITERRLFEEQLNTSLKEKEVLIKEVHHRVKNNLQIVSSLLSLQSETVKDEKIKEMMVESQNRIRSMALIHEKLYQSKELSRLDIRTYIAELVDNILISYLSDKNIVSLNLDIEDIEFGVDVGIDIGLIITELISNSLKYAFPGDYKGEKKISVIIRKDEATGKNKFIVMDNGIGINADFNLAGSESLGLQLVDTLVNQLQGSLRFYNNNGTIVEILF
jgi:PAS domain S-box-containing protein